MALSLSALSASQDEISVRREWVRAHSFPVRKRSVQQKNTRTRAGTLPDSDLHQKNVQSGEKIDLLKSLLIPELHGRMTWCKIHWDKRYLTKTEPLQSKEYVTSSKEMIKLVKMKTKVWISLFEVKNLILLLQLNSDCRVCRIGIGTSGFWMPQDGCGVPDRWVFLTTYGHIHQMSRRATWLRR